MIKTPAIDRVLGSLKQIRKKYEDTSKSNINISNDYIDDELNNKNQNEVYAMYSDLNNSMDSKSMSLPVSQQPQPKPTATDSDSDTNLINESECNFSLQQNPQSVHQLDCVIKKEPSLPTHMNGINANCNPSIFSGISNKARILADREIYTSTSNSNSKSKFN